MKSFPASITASRSLPMLACAAWYGVLVGLGWLVGIREHKEAFMAVGVVSAVLTSFVMMRLGADRAGALTVKWRLLVDALGMR